MTHILAFEKILIALQFFQVAFLWLHDWVSFGRLNDISAVRKQDSLNRLIRVTLIQSIPYTIGLVFSLYYYGRAYHGWISDWLWISYVVLFLGEIRAWWIPYFFRAEPKRAERYQIMFGNTHSFLPKRNGIVPNTLHVILHVATAATIVVLFVS